MLRKMVIAIVITISLVIPALAANAQAATEKRVTSLENSSQVMREDLGNTKLELDTTREKLDATRTELQKSLDAEAQARLDLDKRLVALTKLLENEIQARGETDKMVAELQTEMANKQMAIDNLQQELARERLARQEAETKLAAAISSNSRKDNKDQTITYGLSALLAGLALSNGK